MLFDLMLIVQLFSLFLKIYRVWLDLRIWACLLA